MFNRIQERAVPIISVSLLTIASLFVYTLVFPVDVLKDWTLTVDKDAYVAGDTIRVTTRFSKIRDVSGISKRYIICQALNDSANRIPINEALADRPPQSGVNDIYLKIPKEIPNLPTKCHIEIDIEYEIYAYRRHYEHQRSCLSSDKEEACRDFLVTPSVEAKETLPNDKQEQGVQPSSEGTVGRVTNPNTPPVPPLSNKPQDGGLSFSLQQPPSSDIPRNDSGDNKEPEASPRTQPPNPADIVVDSVFNLVESAKQLVSELL